ncbi:MAG TPA: hypothetical protein VN156_01055, partial [Pseudomonas sp.]|nr:hypothetical protein [Pseudomonas sp.]
MNIVHGGMARPASFILGGQTGKFVADLRCTRQEPAPRLQIRRLGDTREQTGQLRVKRVFLERGFQPGS